MMQPQQMGMINQQHVGPSAATPPHAVQHQQQNHPHMVHEFFTIEADSVL